MTMPTTIAGLGRCPRCRGSLGIEYDFYGWDVACLQCGFRRALNVTGGMRRSQVLSRLSRAVQNANRQSCRRKNAA